MFISLNPDAVGLSSAPFGELLAGAARHGFAGIDFPTQWVRTTAEAMLMAEKVADAGLVWGLFSLPMDFLRGTEEQFQLGLMRLEEVLPLVEAAGCRRTYNHIWPGNNERDPEANFDWHVARLRKLHGLLAGAGVQLGLEFIGPKTLQNTFVFPFVRQLQGTLRLIDAVDGEIGVVLDFFHWYTSGGTLEGLERELAGRPIVNVHANDAVRRRTRDEQQDLERYLPLETEQIDGVGVLQVLQGLGYDGPVIAEPFNPHRARFAQLPMDTVLAEVAASMQGLFRAAGVESVRPR